MRALVLYSSVGNLTALAKALAEGLEAESIRADLMQVDPSRTQPISVAAYDLVCVGSPSLGLVRGRIADDVAEALTRCTRLEGKRTAAFVRRSGFGWSKALKQLMAALEKQGAWVEDFAELGGDEEARAFGRRLKNVAKARA
ncbi:MAG: hypothetical protein IMX02_00640 [Limnochordaceae bacterium]|nr:hypothetical protein [Limnochordaceae bacterium]